MKIDAPALRRRLLAEQAELKDLQEQTEADRAPVDLDQQSVGRLSRMDSLQQQSMALAEERRRVFRLSQIDAALKRLDEDNFGYCVRCDDEIAEKRLELDPAVATCIACASGGEQ